MSEKKVKRKKSGSSKHVPKKTPFLRKIGLFLFVVWL